jgi:hypothetical protein
VKERIAPEQPAPWLWQAKEIFRAFYLTKESLSGKISKE